MRSPIRPLPLPLPSLPRSKAFFSRTVTSSGSKEAPSGDWLEGREEQGARTAGGSRSALMPRLLQVSRGCYARLPAAHMALRGVFARLLSRGHRQSFLRAWGSAQTG